MTQADEQHIDYDLLRSNAERDAERATADRQHDLDALQETIERQRRRDHAESGETGGERDATEQPTAPGT